ncbi:MAG: M20/M25/M40 family metallo-hydrolase, partial [Anaerotignaceae bacterium]
TTEAVEEATTQEVAETQEKSDFEKFQEVLDIQFSEEVIDYISSLGDNPDVGNRSSGSKAEQETADFIMKKFEEIGLTNITKDTITVDTWSFNKARIYYGDDQYISVGGYATQLVADMQAAEIVYVGKGTEADYEGVDVSGKFVLIDIDQLNEWWISHPAYQAHVKGAAGVIAVSVDGYALYDDDTIGVQDVCLDKDIPVLAISRNGAEILKGLMEENSGVAQVVLDVESIITENGQGQNVWAEISGETDEVIYIMAHIDGYFHAFFDDASGVGTMLGIAKAIVDSGYTPNKTIRFIGHGSEEWGKTGVEYDWATGSFKQIMEVHPEWAEDAFAIINLDGFYAVEGQKNFAIATSYELNNFTAKSIEGLTDNTEYFIDVISPTTCYTEDFSYSQAGIPTIVASGGGLQEEPYRNLAYHSSADTKELGFDRDFFKLYHEVFGNALLDLDLLAIRPMDFATRFEAMKESYTGEDIDFDKAIEVSTTLRNYIDSINTDYALAVSENPEKAKEIRQNAITINTWLYELNKEVQQNFVRFNWEGEIIFPHEQPQNNIYYIEGGLEALNAGNGQLAYDDYIYGVDYNWYAYDFDRETFNYNVSRVRDNAVGTWGEGLLDNPNEDLFDVIKSLASK